MGDIVNKVIIVEEVDCFGAKPLNIHLVTTSKEDDSPLNLVGALCVGAEGVGPPFNQRSATSGALLGYLPCLKPCLILLYHPLNGRDNITPFTD